MPSKRKRGNAYELRASCGFNAKGKRIMKTRTWKPPYGMTEAQAEKEATRQAKKKYGAGRCSTSPPAWRISS